MWQLYDSDERRILCDECAGEYADYVNAGEGWKSYRCADCMKRRRSETRCSDFSGYHYYEAPLATCKCGALKSTGAWPWKPGRWFRVVTPTGELWAETSDIEEAKGIALETGYRLERQWYCEPAEWREFPIDRAGGAND
jgi:NMD protein affecting ribosome stability and mRNA decay